MKYLLDTNACITFLRGRNPLLAERLLSHATAYLVVCAIVTGELFHGAEKSRDPIRESARIEGFLQTFGSLPYDLNESRMYGRVRCDLERRGLRIGDSDMQIAGIALTHGLTLVTHNTSEFTRIPNLKIEDWELP